MGRHRQVRLDAARGVAILLVLLFHFRQPLGHPMLDAMLQPLFAVGWAGVDLFFVLSGYLVGRILLAEVAAAGGLDRGGFLTRRAVRLWPVLWMFLAALLLIGGAGTWRSVWPVLLHLQNYDGRAPSHLWSLAVEEHFYLGAALALPPLWRAGGARLVGGCLGALMAGCLVLRLVGLASGVPLLDLQWQTQYRLDAPAFGMALALVSLRRPAVFARLVRPRRLWLGVAVTGLALLAALGEGGWRHGIGLTLAYLASGAAVLGCAGVDQRVPAPPVRWLAGLGLLAYPLYVWHASVGAVTRSLVLAAGGGGGAAMLASMSVAIAVALVVHRAVERPAMRLRDRGRSTAPPAAPAFA